MYECKKGPTNGNLDIQLKCTPWSWNNNSNKYKLIIVLNMRLLSAITQKQHNMCETPLKLIVA